MPVRRWGDGKRSVIEVIDNLFLPVFPPAQRFAVQNFSNNLRGNLTNESVV